MTQRYLRTQISAAGALLLLCGACASPKPETPALSSGNAVALLQLNPKSKNWLDRVQKDNPNVACEYRVEMPDQASHPTTIDVERIVFCGGKPAPRAVNASVSYLYDAASGHWIISRFSS